MTGVQTCALPIWREFHPVRGRDREYWVWPHDRYFIWGATAAILKHLAEKLEEARGR